MIIKLSWQEVYIATVVGIRRRVRGLQLPCRERRGLARKTIAEKWYYNVIGAIGEMAAAKALGIYWPANHDLDKGAPDIPPDWQVRTLAEGWYDLIVRLDDDPKQKYILVTGDPPTLNVVGWIKGADARRDEWWEDKGKRGEPAWWVPQKFLTKFPEKEAVNGTPIGSDFPASDGMQD